MGREGELIRSRRSLIQRFLLDDRNVEKNGYLWYMVGNMLSAFQSVLLLAVINRLLGSKDAGIYNLTFGKANLFLTMGRYGMRYFQVSDMKEEHSFGDYFVSRIITSASMIIAGVVHILYTAMTNSYSSYKTAVAICMIIYKLIDSFEDVVDGRYQNRDRLDIAGRILTIRIAFLIVSFGGGIILFKNMLLALVVSMVLDTLVWMYLVFVTTREFDLSFGKIRKKSVILLLKQCFPLFVGSFLAFYIGDSPKYAVDAVLSDEYQAIYGFVAMPVFIIGLINSFIFNPQIVKMTRIWNSGDVKRFIKKVMLQVGIIAGISVVCLAGAYLLGIPLLSAFFSQDLTAYKAELMILLVGGGFLGLTGLFGAVITIIRFQKTQSWGYGFVALITLIFSNTVVRHFGLRGAAYLYTGLMFLACVVFVIFFAIGVKIKKGKVVS